MERREGVCECVTTWGTRTPSPQRTGGRPNLAPGERSHPRKTEPQGPQGRPSSRRGAGWTPCRAREGQPPSAPGSSTFEELPPHLAVGLQNRRAPLVTHFRRSAIRPSPRSPTPCRRNGSSRVLHLDAEPPQQAPRKKTTPSGMRHTAQASWPHTPANKQPRGTCRTPCCGRPTKQQSVPLEATRTRTTC